ncbi:MAG: hypothetical protein FJ276_31525 [Planctomycetes bacterium]|nr:hypothetical protein [Planctomycetota bacterium]
MFLAVGAYERDAIGDSELARYLRCDLVTAREIVAKAKTSREVEPSGEELQLRLDFQQSLLHGIS